MNPSLYRKLAEVMGEVERVEKRGRNAFHGYDYATEADIAAAVRNGLASRNVAIVPSCDPANIRMERLVKANGEPKGFLTLLPCTFTLVDGDSNETMACPWVGAGEDASDKGIYKAMTGALKYFMLKLFLIPTGDDPEATTGDRTPTAKPTPTATSAPPKPNAIATTAPPKPAPMPATKPGEVYVTGVREAAGKDWKALYVTFSDGRAAGVLTKDEGSDAIIATVLDAAQTRKPVLVNLVPSKKDPAKLKFVSIAYAEDVLV